MGGLASGTYARRADGRAVGLHDASVTHRDLAASVFLASEVHEPTNRDGLFLACWQHVKQQNGWTGSTDKEFTKWLDSKSQAWHDWMLECVVNGKSPLKATYTPKNQKQPAVDEARIEEEYQ